MIVGLTGPARCGKNTIADHLVAKYGFTRLAFSDALYREVAEAFDVPEQVFRDDGCKERCLFPITQCRAPEFVDVLASIYKLTPETRTLQERSGVLSPHWPYSPREILQWWGTEYRRAQDPDYWVKKLDEALQKHFSASAVFPLKLAVDGVRFANEEAYLRGLVGFEMWHIYRPGGPAVASHVSEVEQKNITVHVDTDVVILNNGTIAQLLHIVDVGLDDAYGGDA